MLKPAKTKSADAKPLVFVVDDDDDVREGVRALLQSVSLDCELFRSTVEFLARQPAAETASCLILDVRLPGASGLDFQIELANTHVDIPIIFITGYADVPMSVRAMKAGAVEFLTKPLREQDLLDAVRAALTKDQLRRQRDNQLQQLRQRFASLTEQERLVMLGVTDGLLNKQIAAKMKLAEVTVKAHRHSLIRKLDAKSVPDLVRMVELLGIGKEET
jgi:FixJ family two-component response regulator